LIEERLLHGSDYPVPVNGIWARLRSYISDSEWQRTRGIRNVIERDYQLKLAMGFPPEHFRRVADLLRWEGALNETGSGGLSQEASANMAPTGTSYDAAGV
jgi:hypothetical protein